MSRYARHQPLRALGVGSSIRAFAGGGRQAARPRGEVFCRFGGLRATEEAVDSQCFIFVWRLLGDRQHVPTVESPKRVFIG